MSLTKQLWLAVITILAIALGGTFVIIATVARDYFSEQLFVKNVDNATVLAQSMTLMKGDPVAMELLLAAQFDAGHYRFIRLTDPTGAVLSEREDDTSIRDVPAAFVASLPFDIAPGVAQVQNGWKQYGTLSLQSQDHYAYTELWRGVQQLVLWFTLTLMLAGIAGSVLLKLILRPLTTVIIQAEAIGVRRFIKQPVPKTVEFRQLVVAMNTLSDSVAEMLATEAGRVEELRQLAQLDPLTGLRNRQSFIATMEDTLQRDDISESGVVVVLRVTGLAELNREIGREAVDQLLHRIGERLGHAAAAHAPLWTVARLNSADFAAMALGEADAAFIAGLLAAQANLAMGASGDSRVLAGCTLFHRGESRSAILSRVDGALARSEQSGAAVVQADDTTMQVAAPTDLVSWRQSLHEAMATEGVKLGRHPVKSAHGSILHFEAPVRLKIEYEWQPAARFVAWAARLDLLPALDLMVVKAALVQIGASNTRLSVNISSEALCDATFSEQLAAELRHAQDAAGMLLFDVPEYGALRHRAEFGTFCERVKSFGCKVGLKHAGHQVSRISEFHDLGLDYLKIDGSIVQGMHDGMAHQTFLRGLCSIAHAIGLTTIATGIVDASDLAPLEKLGVDGFTGPAI